MLTPRIPPSVGYSVLRTGKGDAFEVCIVAPHVDVPRSIVFDPISRRLDVISPVVSVSLPELPADVAHLLAKAPNRVMLVCTDSLSVVRFAGRAGDLSSAELH